MVPKYTLQQNLQKNNMMQKRTPGDNSEANFSSDIEQRLGYCFKNTDLLNFATTHPGTYPQKHSCASKKFEKLEFLGDRVLGLSLADLLYKHFPDETEGQLAVRMAALAGTDFLIELAKRTKLINCFKIPKDFYVSSHKNSSSIADMMEAVFGAVFLDSDFKTAQSIISKIYKDDIDRVIYRKKDAKTRLQEVTQAKTAKLPVYRLIKTVGEVHNPIFEMEVSACEKIAVGQGNSKKMAEHDAAEKLLKMLEDKA